MPCQVHWLNSIGLITHLGCSFINFPRLVSIPEGPLTIFDPEVMLKAFSKSPFDRRVNHIERVVKIAEIDVVYGEESFPSIRSFEGYQVLLIDFHFDLTFFEEGIGTCTCSWLVLKVSIDVEARVFFKVLVLGEGNAEHIGLPAGDIEVVLLSVFDDEVDLFEILVCKGVDPEDSSRVAVDEESGKC